MHGEDNDDGDSDDILALWPGVRMYLAYELHPPGLQLQLLLLQVLPGPTHPTVADGGRYEQPLLLAARPSHLPRAHSGLTFNIMVSMVIMVNIVNMVIALQFLIRMTVNEV